MTKSVLVYTVFFSLFFSYFPMSLQKAEDHCRAQTLEDQDSIGRDLTEDTADSINNTNKENTTDKTITTDKDKSADNKNSSVRENIPDKEDTPPPVDKWSFLKISEYDVLPQKRGLTALHYPASNENRIDLFYDFIKDLGGGYVGVGTDQNFTFIAWARSEYAYLMDFDPVVVAINRIHLHFFDISPDYPAFRKLWSRKNKKESLNIIRDRFRNDPDYSTIVKAFHLSTGEWAPVPDRLRTLEKLTRNHKLKTFVNKPDDYDYIRGLVKLGRIQAVPGDLRGSKTFLSINNAARKIEIPLRVFYASNAEDYFKAYSEEFRKSIIDMPVDETGFLIRTCSVRAKRMGFPEGEMLPDRPYHYNVQPLKNMQEWMKNTSTRRIHTILNKRTGVSKGLSIVKHLPESRKD